ncbi:acyl carrier protein [Pseudoalteromonas ostreae]|uniref:acyl carrier protein n=1 Tax=Pseudoalteromonas ostreae TaxID=2774154 RepID=UPI001B37D3D4|nr:acyl carrier protein [Pseudoalteromonas ostreae]
MNKSFCKNTLINDISDYIVMRIEGNNGEIQRDISFSRLGLDSAGHVQISAIIEDHMQIDVSPTVAFDHPTINSLIKYIDELTIAHIEEAEL